MERPAPPPTRGTGSATYRGRRPGMKKTTRRNARVPAAAATKEASRLRKLDTASLSEIIHALANGRITATSLTKFYLSRIEACDRGGPMLNSVREINPEALAIASNLDGAKPSVER